MGTAGNVRIPLVFDHLADLSDRCLGMGTAPHAKKSQQRPGTAGVFEATAAADRTEPGSAGRFKGSVRSAAAAPPSLSLPTGVEDRGHAADPGAKTVSVSAVISFFSVASLCHRTADPLVSGTSGPKLAGASPAAKTPAACTAILRYSGVFFAEDPTAHTGAFLLFLWMTHKTTRTCDVWFELFLSRQFLSNSKKQSFPFWKLIHDPNHRKTVRLRERKGDESPISSPFYIEWWNNTLYRRTMDRFFIF